MSELNDDPYVVGRRLGLDVVTPSKRQLFLDVDCDADHSHMQEMLDLFGSVLSARDLPEVTRTTMSKSGRRHVYVDAEHLLVDMLATTTREHAILRIALQACLGSDRKRELLSLLRVLLKLDRPATVFFEKPEVP